MGRGRIELPTPRSSAVCSPSELPSHNILDRISLLKIVVQKMKFFPVDIKKTVFILSKKVEKFIKKIELVISFTRSEIIEMSEGNNSESNKTNESNGKGYLLTLELCMHECRNKNSSDKLEKVISSISKIVYKYKNAKGYCYTLLPLSVLREVWFYYL